MFGSKNVSRIWLFALAATPLLAGNRGCEPEPEPEPCFCPAVYAPVCGVDGMTYGNACEAACAEVEVAYEGECRADGCYGDADCDAGYECNAAEVCMSPPGCRPGEPCPAVCYGECVPKVPAPEEGCYSDDDCAEGTHCNAAEVCLPPPGCEPGGACPTVCYGMCIEDEPPPPPPADGCYSDSECGEGTHCNASEVCLPPPGCEPGMACPTVCYGMCVPDEPAGCYGDTECGDGLRCNAAEVCLPPPGCEPGDICPAVCYGMCVPAEPVCEPVACRLYCEHGFATGRDGCEICECAEPPAPPAPRLCLSDSACDASEYCDHSECLSPCGPDEICPAVCYGQCLPAATR